MRAIAEALKAYWRQLSRKGPILAIYYLTYRCNSKCIYCDIWKRGSEIADTQDVLRNLEDLAKMGIRFVSFTGGEPLLFPSLPLVLDRAKKLGMRTTLITNGTLYARRAGELRGLVDDLEFSVSTIRADRYRWERGVDSLPEVINGIEKALSLGEPLSILTTTFQENLSDLAGVIDYTRRLGVLCIIGPVYDYFGNAPFPRDLADCLRVYSSQKGVWMNRAFIEFLSSGGNCINRPRCTAMSATLAISPDDRLLLPCYHHCLQELPISGKLLGLCRAEPYKEMTKKVGRWEFCKGCNIFCYFEGSFLWPPDRYFCLDAMSRIRWLMQMRSINRMGQTRNPSERDVK